jgi:hypothetical protein
MWTPRLRERVRRLSQWGLQAQLAIGFVRRLRFVSSVSTVGYFEKEDDPLSDRWLRLGTILDAAIWLPTGS